MIILLKSSLPYQILVFHGIYLTIYRFLKLPGAALPGFLWVVITQRALPSGGLLLEDLGTWWTHGMGETL